MVDAFYENVNEHLIPDPVEEKIDSISAVLFNLKAKDPETKSIINYCEDNLRDGKSYFYPILSNLLIESGVSFEGFSDEEIHRIIHYAIMTVALDQIDENLMPDTETLEGNAS